MFSLYWLKLKVSSKEITLSHPLILGMIYDSTVFGLLIQTDSDVSDIMNPFGGDH